MKIREEKKDDIVGRGKRVLKGVSQYDTYQKNPSASGVCDEDLSYKKLYNEAIPVVSGFGIPALKVWCHILKVLEPGRDDIAIVMKECVKECGYTSSVNVYKGLAELLAKRVIFRKRGHKSIYYINIKHIAHGN